MPQTARKVLLARIGWMKYYGCINNSGGDPLIGGGKWDDHDNAGELYNFRVIGGRLYGYVKPVFGSINLRRIEASVGDEARELGGVTIIFVATDPNAPPETERQRIVGWYTNADVYRDYKDHPSLASRHYNVISNANAAVLLPTQLRKQPIPRARPGAMGQSNVWYTLDESGKVRNPLWLTKALAYVTSYGGDSLLEKPEIELAQGVRTELENSAGFESNQRIRNAVEAHAMKRVRRYYEAGNYKTEDKHKSRPYDFECTKRGRLRYVEVKGTQTLGNQVLLTPNEVRLPDRKGAIVDLCVVHSVKVTDGKTVKCSGGTLVRYENWRPRDHDIRAVSFICDLSKSKR